MVLIPLLPLILSLLLMMAVLLPLFPKMQIAEDHCRMGVLNAQARLLSGLEKIKSLSEVAHQLYLMEVEALRYRAMVLAIPHLRIPAEAALRSIQSAQRTLNLTQLWTLNRTHLVAHKTLQSTKGQLEDHLKHLGGTLLGTPFTYPQPRLHVLREQKGSSHVYRPHDNFETLQVVSGRWQINPFTHMNSWKSFFKSPWWRLSLQCSALIEKGENEKWTPVLSAVKRSSNF